MDEDLRLLQRRAESGSVTEKIRYYHALDRCGRLQFSSLDAWWKENVTSTDKDSPQLYRDVVHTQTFLKFYQNVANVQKQEKSMQLGFWSFKNSVLGGKNRPSLKTMVIVLINHKDQITVGHGGLMRNRVVPQHVWTNFPKIWYEGVESGFRLIEVPTPGTFGGALYQQALRWVTCKDKRGNHKYEKDRFTASKATWEAWLEVQAAT